MSFKGSRLKLFALATFGIGSMLVLPIGANAQNQAIFQDDRQLMQTDQNQVQQYENQVQNYEQSAEQHDKAADTYKLYAEKRIQELTKLKSSGGSPTKSLAKDKNGELYALEAWMKSDAQSRAAEQAHIKQLDQAIANLQQSQQAASQNMGNDVGAMREVAQRQADDDKFNQQMQMNYFNELQTEAGYREAYPRRAYGGSGGYGGGGYGNGFWGGYGFSQGAGR